MKRLSVVMPVYNEQDCIAIVVRDWYKMLLQRFNEEDFSFIIVDDGSKDNTAEILQQMQKEYPSILLICQPNGGHGNAVLNGYKKALDLESEYVFQVDSDNQFEPDDFGLLWDRRIESPFILGQRKIRHDAFVRLIITRIVILINLILFFVYIPDANIPYRLMRGKFLAKLMKQMPFSPFIPNIFLSLLAKKQFVNVLSIPVKHKERSTGTVSILRWKLLKVCLQCTAQLLKLRYFLIFPFKPKEEVNTCINSFANKLSNLPKDEKSF